MKKKRNDFEEIRQLIHLFKENNKRSPFFGIAFFRLLEFIDKIKYQIVILKIFKEYKLLLILLILKYRYKLNEENSLRNGIYNPISPKNRREKRLVKLIYNIDIFYGKNIDRFNGLIFEDVLFERFHQLGIDYEDLTPIDKKILDKSLPDSILQINGKKIAIEFKTMQIFDDFLILDKGLFRKYDKYQNENNIDHMLIFHSPFFFDQDPLMLMSFGFNNIQFYSTDNAFLIPLSCYISLPTSLNAIDKKKRKKNFGINYNDALSHDLLVNGWEKLEDNFQLICDGKDVVPNIEKIICINCNKEYNCLKLFFPYIKEISGIKYSFCLKCGTKRVGAPPIISDSEHDKVISEIENYNST